MSAMMTAQTIGTTMIMVRESPDPEWSEEVVEAVDKPGLDDGGPGTVVEAAAV